ncbi:MAG: PRTRC system protein B [Candidatus Angelobacter sp.]
MSRALLVYGKSSYEGFPYRHPFVTIHDVIHEQDGARLAEGQLLTSQILIDLMAGLGRALPLEILPGRVLVRTEDRVVWWSAARRRRMFFSDHGGDAAKELSGMLCPQPPLLYKVSGTHLWIRALLANERPLPETRLCIAPYWNCYDNGVVCTGSMRIPREKTVAAIDLWEESFFNSEFTHAAGIGMHTQHRRGLVAMWKSLASKKRFPSRYLVPTKQTLAEFVNDHDHSYRNETRTG